jgi:hypothetical protein
MYIHTVDKRHLSCYSFPGIKASNVFCGTLCVRAWVRACARARVGERERESERVTNWSFEQGGKAHMQPNEDQRETKKK